MKINFKAWLGAACMLFASAAASAAEAPAFSTVDSPLWYKIKFTKGENVLKDAGNGKNLVTAAATVTATSAQWQLIGAADNFQLRDKAKRYVSFDETSGRFTSSTDATKAVNLQLKEVDSGWEIARVGQDKSMNQWGGTSVGVELGEWTSGDPNNKLTFLALSAIPPTFSNGEGADTWYFIQFAQNGAVITSNGIGNVVTRPVQVTPVNSKIWKLVGNDSGFQLVNKDGEYLTVTGSGNDARVVASATADPSGFALVASPASAHPGTWEIRAKSISGSNNCMNLWQGANVAHQEIGFWAGGASETGNSLRFVPEGSMEFAEFGYVPSQTYRPEQKLTLWYTRPATTSTEAQQWMDLGLPIGNGQFGAMVLGGLKKEDISVNEKTLWTGTKNDNSSSYGCYQNFGSLFINSLAEEGLGWDEKAARDYWRNLDLTTGIASVSYANAAGTRFTRQYIASNPDNVVAALLTASTPGGINVKFVEEPGMLPKYVTTPLTYSADGTITYGGKFETVSFHAAIKIVPVGGTMTAEDDGITVKGADKVYVVIAGGTDYDPLASNYTSDTAALPGRIEARAAAAATKGWEAVLADHIADHQKYFNRVDFQLAGTVNEMPTDEMINHYQDVTATDINSDDPAVKMLEQLYFHYGRYLHIGSSRGVDLPNNLQGIWSGYTYKKPYGGQIAPWNADIHNNINLQMCYWPAEPTNLSELHLPFLNYLINMATKQPQWQKYAKDSGQTKGWTFFTESNIFGGSGSFMHNYTIANAWCCSHLFQHYDYTLDKEFLLRAFPTIWSACEFWMERLKKGSDGTWEAPNEYSPEHGPGSSNATAHAQQILVDLFSNTLKAIDTLGLEACGLTQAEVDKLQGYYDGLDTGLAIEKYNGAWGTTALASGQDLLREWKYATFSSGQNGHRHMSHLMCLYPYSQVEPGSDYFNAAVNSMKLRGDGATGWSMGWKINLWAHAMDGDHARVILRNALCSTHRNGSGVYLNLFDSHSPFQIDGNFGACTGIGEMLLQSRNGVIYVLPALPTLWTEGSISGMKAVGDVTVDIEWKNGKLVSATLVPNQGGDLKIVHSDMANLAVLVNGTPVKPEVGANGLITLPATAPGSVITLNYTGESSISSVEAQKELSVSVSNGKVEVKGAKVSAISVYDVAGRQVGASASSVCTVNASAGSVVLVKATDSDGEVHTLKAVI